MNPLRLVVVALASSLVACASHPMVRAAETRTNVVPPSTIGSIAARERSPSRPSPPSLVELVRRTKTSAAAREIVAVFTANGSTSLAVRTLEEAGMSVAVFTTDFAQATPEAIPEGVAAIVVEGPPGSTWREPTSKMGSKIPIIATWTGERADDVFFGNELTEGRGPRALQFVVWCRCAFDGEGLAALSVPPPGVRYEPDGRAVVSGRLTHRHDHPILLLSSGPRRHEVLLHGDRMPSLIAGARRRSDADPVATFRGRLRFVSAAEEGTYWELELEDAADHD